MTTGTTPDLLIYTDASHLRTCKGSWAAVLRWDGGEEIHSGKFKTACATSTLAELQAIANGITAGLKSGRAGKSVLILSDCKGVITGLTRTKRRYGWKGDAKAELLLAHRAIERLIEENPEIRFAFQWVPGHQPADSPCPHVAGNRRADHAARAALKEIGEQKAKRAARRKRYRARRKARRAEALACASAPTREGVTA